MSAMGEKGKEVCEGENIFLRPIKAMQLLDGDTETQRVQK